MFIIFQTAAKLMLDAKVILIFGSLFGTFTLFASSNGHSKIFFKHLAYNPKNIQIQAVT